MTQGVITSKQYHNIERGCFNASMPRLSESLIRDAFPKLSPWFDGGARGVCARRRAAAIPARHDELARHLVVQAASS